MNRIAMIAAAGRGSRMMSLTENNPKAMLPFNCKPIIGHHLDYLIREGFKEVVIIVGYKKEKLIDYVCKFYMDKINIRFAIQSELNGLAGAIFNGIQVLSDKEINSSYLFILLGDIVLNSSFDCDDYSHTFIGYDIVEDWSRWCLIETEDSLVKSFIDKPDEKPNTNKNTMGVYNITDIELLRRSLEDVFISDIKIRNEFQISQALEIYCSSRDIFAIHISDYFDLGELDALNKTRKNITRHFNTIIPTNENTVIKKSTDINKIKKEINWFLKLNRRLSIYTPHLVNYDEEFGIYELEFIHSSPIQELYLFNLPEKYQWVEIFKAINKYLDKCKVIEDEGDMRCLDENNYKMIFDKTVNRVNKVKEYDFAKEDFITINNIIYKNPIKHMSKIFDLIIEMFCLNGFHSYKYFRRLHGDLFFGNMLYDVNTNVLKLIDPRGQYGEYSNHGDIRYDIAKLNHSVNGYYDFIVNGLYFLEEKDNKLFYHFYESRQYEVKKLFNDIILKNYDKKEIKLLTGLLFLTMIPLHSENPANQKMQFIKAVEFLNEFI